MKKHFSLITLLLVACQAMAQIQFGPMAGVNLSTVSAKALGESYSPKMKIGFHAGGVVNIGISEHFSIMPGILFSSKGTKIDEDKTGFGITYHDDETVTANYLEVPVNAMYMFGQEGGGRFFIHAGPYIGYCLGGKIKATVSYPGTALPDKETDEKMKVGNKLGEDNTRPLDYGINAGLGYMLPMGLFFKAQYGLGLANTMPEGDADNYIRNRVIGISVGFLFGGNGGGYR